MRLCNLSHGYFLLGREKHNRNNIANALLKLNLSCRCLIVLRIGKVVSMQAIYRHHQLNDEIHVQSSEFSCMERQSTEASCSGVYITGIWCHPNIYETACSVAQGIFCFVLSPLLVFSGIRTSRSLNAEAGTKVQPNQNHLVLGCT